MKFTIPLLLSGLLILLSPIACKAAELSNDALKGKWIFTHISMDDGSREIKVNRPTEFLADGSLVNYDAAGNEKSRGTYKVSGDMIIYTDDNGEQKWDVLSFDEHELHVDHRGAEMFFKRQ